VFSLGNILGTYQRHSAGPPSPPDATAIIRYRPIVCVMTATTAMPVVIQQYPKLLIRSGDLCDARHVFELGRGCLETSELCGLNTYQEHDVLAEVSEEAIRDFGAQGLPDAPDPDSPEMQRLFCSTGSLALSF
jgi:hypothetical protein